MIVKSQALRFVPLANCVSLFKAATIVFCTRSSAASRSRHMNLAKARKSGSNATRSSFIINDDLLDRLSIENVMVLYVGTHDAAAKPPTGFGEKSKNHGHRIGEMPGTSHGGLRYVCIRNLERKMGVQQFCGCWTLIPVLLLMWAIGWLH